MYGTAGDFHLIGIPKKKSVGKRKGGGEGGGPWLINWDKIHVYIMKAAKFEAIHSFFVHFIISVALNPQENDFDKNFPVTTSRD